MSKSKMIKSAITIAAMVGIASPALAQFASGSSGPIAIDADSGYVAAENMMKLKGQVDVRQGETRILSDEMDIYTKGSANNITTGDFDRVVATGNFYYLTPDQEVRGDKGVYEKATETFTVTGNVIMVQGEDNVVTGDRLVYNLTTNEARITGNCKGRKCGRKGRVRILIKNTGSTITRG